MKKTKKEIAIRLKLKKVCKEMDQIEKVIYRANKVHSKLFARWMALSSTDGGYRMIVYCVFYVMDRCSDPVLVDIFRDEDKAKKSIEDKDQDTYYIENWILTE